MAIFGSQCRFCSSEPKAKIGYITRAPCTEANERTPESPVSAQRAEKFLDSAFPLTGRIDIPVKVTARKVALILLRKALRDFIVFESSEYRV